MCGRFVQDDELNSIIEHFAITTNRFQDYLPRFNIAPTNTVGVVLEHRQKSGGHHRLFGPARWSLVPPWEKSLTLRYSTFNARSEKVGSTRTFRHALARQRALIPTGGYYEWVASDSGKVPHFIHSTSETPLAFAGLYSWWQGNEGEAPLCTVTVLTCDSPNSLSWVHPRTPVFVPPSTWNEWLDPALVADQSFVDELVAQQSEVTGTLEAYAVGPVRGDGPGLIQRLTA